MSTERSINLDRKSFTISVSAEELEDVPVIKRSELPLLWARLSCLVRIIDLKEQDFAEALALFKNYYIREEVLCKASDLSDDEESVENYLDTLKYWMKDTTSLIAVHEGTREIIGVLVGRVMNRLDHSRTFSRMRPVQCDCQLTEGKALDKIVNLRCHMNKTFDVCEHHGVDEFFRIYALTVKPQHRGKGIGMALMDSALRLAKLLRQTVLMGIFSSAQSQRLALKLGMETKLEIYYSEWIVDDKVVFEDPGAGNYSVMLMTMEFPRSPSPFDDEIITIEPSEHHTEDKDKLDQSKSVKSVKSSSAKSLKPVKSDQKSEKSV